MALGSRTGSIARAIGHGAARVLSGHDAKAVGGAARCRADACLLSSASVAPQSLCLTARLPWNRAFPWAHGHLVTHRAESMCLLGIRAPVVVATVRTGVQRYGIQVRGARHLCLVGVEGDDVDNDGSDRVGGEVHEVIRKLLALQVKIHYFPPVLWVGGKV